jgi:hypothetical protein
MLHRTALDRLLSARRPEYDGFETDHGWNRPNPQLRVFDGHLTYCDAISF